jgi:hypothetical protein
MQTILSRMLSTLAAAAQTADRIDYWIRRHVIEYRDETHPSIWPIRAITDSKRRLKC